MRNRNEAMAVVAAVVLFVAALAILIAVQVYYEHWRASIWAEEMRKAGVKTEAPR